MRFTRLLIPTLATAALLAGCGGDTADKADDPGKTPMPDATATPKPVTYEPIPKAAAGLVKLRMSEEKVREIAGVEPILVQRPTDVFSGGCLYYRIESAAPIPPNNTWRYCFSRKRGLLNLLTQISPDQPLPPKGVSQQREAMIGRGDDICKADYGRLTPITDRVATALKAYGRKATPAATAAVDKAIGAFVRNVSGTAEQLSAFEPPPEAADTLTAYTDALQAQVDVLTRARGAFADGDMATYDDLGAEFTELGAEGKRQAKEYGFSTCSASTFG